MLPAQMDARREAAMLRSRLSTEAGGSSDHLSTVIAYNGWKATKAVRSNKKERNSAKCAF